MEYLVGLDASLRFCAMCVVDSRGKIYLERELPCEFEDGTDVNGPLPTLVVLPISAVQLLESCRLIHHAAFSPIQGRKGRPKQPRAGPLSNAVAQLYGFRKFV